MAGELDSRIVGDTFLSYYFQFWGARVGGEEKYLAAARKIHNKQQSTWEVGSVPGRQKTCGSYFTAGSRQTNNILANAMAAISSPVQWWQDSPFRGKVKRIPHFLRNKYYVYRCNLRSGTARLVSLFRVKNRKTAKNRRWCMSLDYPYMFVFKACRQEICP